MNIFNKIVIIIILLFLAVVSAVGIINEFVGYFKWSDVALRIFNPGVDINPFVSSLALLFVLAISIFLILLEFYRRKPRVATIYRVKEGNAMITLESIAQQIKSSVQAVGGVEDISIRIQPKPKGIINNMQVDLNEEVDIPNKMQEIINVAQDVASNKLGIKIIKTNLTIVGLKEGKIKEAQKEQKELQVEEQVQEDIQE
ncbi:MAG: hypothetical protein ACQEP5_01115 [Actinomycetota bacterium]